uniref:Magnetosome protein Mad23 n=1 Tax=Candidatus Magnetananas rongchengensis TaxID=1463558 RepID=A0A3Q8BKE3_9BACT|nr:magnetosome protein Mad23 [Candidatus Magnetananas rongchenensis]
MEKDNKKSAVMNGIAKVFNAGGTGVVFAYDATSSALKKAYSYMKKAGKAKRMFTKGLATVTTSEVKQLKDKIGQYERKIKALYFEIGKEGSKHSVSESPLEAESVRQLIADVREYEKEIKRFEDRIVEIKEQKRAASEQKKEAKKTGKKVVKKEDIVRQVRKGIENTIAKSVRHAEFDSLSEREVFDKVAKDLLDNEMEIKILAAAELGKIGNPAAVPILMEAARYNNSNLTSEVINSLISINDPQAVELFKGRINDPKFTVRIGCLRGLYKMADDDVAIPIFIDGLRDKHPEVRRTAATFIGWRDYTDAAPSLIQALRDNDMRVRKAAIAALSNIKEETAVMSIINALGDKELEVREKAYDAIRVITGEDIKFDAHTYGKELKNSINEIKDWWQQRRLDKAEDAEYEEDSVAADVVVDTAVEPDEVESDEVEADEVESDEVEADEIEVVEAEEPEVVETEEEVVEDEVEEEEYDEETLDGMLKGDLLEICRDRNIDHQDSMSHEELKNLILGIETEEEEEKFEIEEYDEETLDGMLKGDLLEICRDRNIDHQDSMSHDELKNLILGIPNYDEETLDRMLKGDLLEICRDRNIDHQDSMSHDELKTLILGE